MSTSNFFPISASSSAVPQSTQGQHHRERSRTMSLLSLKLGTLESPSPESPKAQATVVLRSFLPAMHPHAHWGTDSTCPRKEWEGNPSSSLLTPF
ncbi:hypothetical protein AGABI1DRAFT_114013, partial [Agaricus bisporus var. burnettii JB137-S8]